VEEEISMEDLKEDLLTNPDMEFVFFIFTQRLDKPLKIKLLITDIHQDNILKKNLRSLMSPILSNLHMLPEFGIFHTALCIGPWKIVFTL
jgi:hypothetical protein